MIPIKGYATFDKLKHCWIGTGFQTEWFKDLSIFKNDKILDPLKRIEQETNEDLETLEKILRSAGVTTHRHWLDVEKFPFKTYKQKPPICPRDEFAVIGEKFYLPLDGIGAMSNKIIEQIEYENCEFVVGGVVSTANICRVGKDIWWDIAIPKYQTEKIVQKYKAKWEEQNFRVHISTRGYHSDSSFCVVKPGCIVSLYDIQNYQTEFPGWEVMYLPDQSWKKMSDFYQIKDKVGGRWWLKGEEHNDQLINFVNTWLNDWVGYVEETVFDVNMLSLDQNTIICNNYNKEVFDFFKKHKVEPIVFNFRHRFFWDGGVHCVTQDLYREGKAEDYFS